MNIVQQYLCNIIQFLTLMQLAIICISQLIFSLYNCICSLQSVICWIWQTYCQLSISYCCIRQAESYRMVGALFNCQYDYILVLITYMNYSLWNHSLLFLYLLVMKCTLEQEQVLQNINLLVNYLALKHQQVLVVLKLQIYLDTINNCFLIQLKYTLAVLPMLLQKASILTQYSFTRFLNLMIFMLGQVSNL